MPADVKSAASASRSCPLRRKYPYSFKLYCVQTALAWRDATAAATALGVPPRTVQNWVSGRGFDPRKRAKLKPGKKPALSQGVEAEIATAVRAMRSFSRRVSMRMLMALGIVIARRRGYDHFQASKTWRKNFCLRNGFRYRKARRRQTQHSPDELRASARSFLESVALLFAQHALRAVDILCCDEFAVDLFNEQNKTLTDVETGDSNVIAMDKPSHVTAACTADASGQWRTTMLIFACGSGTGERTAPIAAASGRDVLIRYSKSGFMNVRLYSELIESLVSQHRRLHGADRPLVFVHDFHRTVHCAKEIKALLERLNVHEILIPGDLTPIFGALDVRAFALLQTLIPISYEMHLFKRMQDQSAKTDARTWRDLITTFFFDAIAEASSSEVSEGFLIASLFPEDGVFRPVRVYGERMQAVVPTVFPKCSICGPSTSASSSSSSSSSLLSSHPLPLPPPPPQHARAADPSSSSSEGEFRSRSRSRSKDSDEERAKSPNVKTESNRARQRSASVKAPRRSRSRQPRAPCHVATEPQHQPQRHSTRRRVMSTEGVRAMVSEMDLSDVMEGLALS